MDVITRDLPLAAAILPHLGELRPHLPVGVEEDLHGGAPEPLWRGTADLPGGWQSIHVVAEPRASQFDLLLRRMREHGDVPDRSLYLGGWGDRFHGQRGRAWVGLRDNLHLSVHLALDIPLERVGAGMTALAAVSLVEAIDEIPALTGHPRIKWVNDVYLGDAKVAGFLAHVSSRGGRMTGAILGVGVNVARSPEIPAGDPIIRRATSLARHLETTGAVPGATAAPLAGGGAIPGATGAPRAGGGAIPGASGAPPVGGEADPVTLATFLPRLTGRLAGNVDLLLAHGPGPLVAAYRRRSFVVGRRVRVISDPVEGSPRPGAEGVVTAIGDGLELHIAGVAEPIREGRLELLDEADSPS
jgi:biotin-(acetyl-CoA carboxylase) ligase